MEVTLINKYRVMKDLLKEHVEAQEELNTELKRIALGKQIVIFEGVLPILSKLPEQAVICEK